MKPLLYLILLLFCVGGSVSRAQDNFVSGWSLDTEAEPVAPLRPVASVLTFQLGASKVRDTYLTALAYTGPSWGVQYERWRLRRRCRWVNEQVLNLDVSRPEDAAKNGYMWAGRLRYRYVMMKRWPSGDSRSAPWAFYLGPYAGADLGFNYNMKLAASNNPATVRLAGNLGASGAVAYRYRMGGQDCSLMLQAQAPLLGTALVPEYGASYYETFYLGDRDNTVHFTSLHNQQDLDLRLTTDIPLSVLGFLRRSDGTIRLGAAYHIETMDINHIVTRYSSFEFVIGWVRQYLPYSRRKANMLKSSAYEAF